MSHIRLPLISFAIVLAVVAVPTASFAGPFSVLSFCGGLSNNILNAVGSVSVDQQCSVAAGTGDARAQIDITSGLSFGAGSTVTSISTAPIDAGAAARVADTVTILGGAIGTSGFLQLTFAIDGSCSSFLSSCSFTSFLSGINALGELAGNAASVSLNGNQAATLNIPLTFGTAAPVTVSLIVDSGLNQFGASQTTFRTLTEDFYGTATLTGVAVLDGQKTVLSGGSVADTDSLFNSTQPVPEPATCLTIATGLAFLAGRRRRPSVQR